MERDSSSDRTPLAAIDHDDRGREASRRSCCCCGPSSCCSRRSCGWWCGWSGVTVFSIYFVFYIFASFLAEPVRDWITVQNFSTPVRAIPMAIHWVGGTTVLLVGPLQLIPCIRANQPALHRWLGRAFMMATFATCAAGMTYILVNGTVGGIAMDVPFALYGVTFAVCAAMAWYHARQKNWAQHRAWALRLFSQGIGSALYRVYVFPLFISVLPDMQESGKLLWLTIAAWFFFLPNLLLVEIYLRYERRGNAGKLRVPRSELPMHA